MAEKRNIEIRVSDLVFIWIKFAAEADVISCDSHEALAHFQGFISGILSGAELQPEELERFVTMEIEPK